MIKPSLLASDFVPKNAINDQVKSKTDEQRQTLNKLSLYRHRPSLWVKICLNTKYNRLILYFRRTSIKDL